MGSTYVNTTIYHSDPDDARTIRRLRHQVRLLEELNRQKSEWIEAALVLDVQQTGEINSLRETVAARDADIAEAMKSLNEFDLDPSNPPQQLPTGEPNGPEPTQ